MRDKTKIIEFLQWLAFNRLKKIIRFYRRVPCDSLLSGAVSSWLFILSHSIQVIKGSGHERHIIIWKLKIVPESQSSRTNLSQLVVILYMKSKLKYSDKQLWPIHFYSSIFKCVTVKMRYQTSLLRSGLAIWFPAKNKHYFQRSYSTWL